MEYPVLIFVHLEYFEHIATIQNPVRKWKHAGKRKENSKPLTQIPDVIPL